MKQAAMYVRVSTQQQKEGATIESQKALLLDYAKNMGIEIHPEWIFEDNGISGSTLVRPGLDKLRDLASEGLFDQVFILSPDRLSRKYAYQAILLEEFKAIHVKIIFQNSPEPKSPGDHLLLQIQGMFAEYERAIIAERSRRGKIHKARSGDVSVFSRASYGYRYIKGTEGMKSWFEIIEKEALVVKTIFDLYVKKRFSMEKIRVYLAKHNIRSPKGNSEWSRNTINGILNNSAYRGIAYFGKIRKGDPDSQRLLPRFVRINGRRTPMRSYRPNDPKKWIEIPVPAIIDNDTFELAQELMKKNKHLSSRNSKPGSLLQGLISCSECGYGFITTTSGKNANGYRYYRCSKQGGECSNQGIRMEVLDEAIWSSLVSILNTPELIQDEVSRRMSELDQGAYYHLQKKLDAKLDKLKNESSLLLDAYQNQCIDLKELKKRMSIIKNEENNTLRELENVNKGLSKKQLLELTESVKYFSNHLKASQQELSFEEKRKIFRMLVQEIQIGHEGITVNHIIPVKKKESFEKIARLHTGRSGVPETKTFLVKPQRVSTKF